MNWILGLISIIGTVILKIFAGRTGRVADVIRPVALALVKFFETTTLTGKERFTAAFELLTNFAIKAGLEQADHAIELAIEWSIADVRGKNVKEIFNEGLALARQVVAEVGQLALDSDMAKKLEAAEILRMKLTYEMKEWLTDTNTLYLLIVAALSETKTE